jgi:uncharacterized protein YbjQ (UPF0145 family)
VPVPGLRSLLVTMDQAVEPLGVVLGAGVFQIWRPTTCAQVAFQRSGEPLVYTSYENAVHDAWATAVGRLEEEARAIGAHGVLGTYVSQRWLAEGWNLEVELRGTAVRLEGEPPLARPFLSTLSMESFLKLLIGGWVPCGIAWAVSAVHVHGYDASPMLMGSALSNVEMPVPTAAVLLTRERLEAQTRASLAACRAEGGVGMAVTMERRSQACGGGNGVLIDGLMLGTGVVRYRPSLSSASVARNLRTEGRKQ